MYKLAFIIAAILLFNFTAYSQEKGLDTLFVASWNLENLFDTVKDSGKSDQQFTPESIINWTEERLNKKLENLAKVISDMNEERGPDILGVVEVEHRALLDSMISRYLKNENYKVAYAESPDPRGIDNGLIYNSKKLELINIIPDTVRLFDNYPTRLIINVNLLYMGKDTLNIFVNHWPARVGGVEKTEVNRIDAAKVLYSKVKGCIATNPKSKIIILGDFNDEPGSISIKNILSADSINCSQNNSRIADNHLSLLYNLAYQDYSKGLGTYKYKDNWNLLDQIIVSQGLINGEKLKYICGSFEIFKPEFMITHSGKFQGAPFPTYGGRKYLGGYSDHFPVTAEFILIRR